MQINGTTVPNWIIIPVFTFIFGLGGTYYQIDALADELAEHQEKPMHETAVADVATIKNDVKHNKEAIDELKESVKELEEQIAENQRELLEVLREEE